MHYIATLTARLHVKQLRIIQNHDRKICQQVYNAWACRTFATAISNNNSTSENSVAQLATNEELTAIVDQFPHKIDYAFGYGSGVLRQQQSTTTTNPGMIDIILAVNDPYAWHKHNLKCHSDHYSYMARIGGSNFVTWLQVNFGAKLYFHPFVNMDITLNDDCDTNNTNDESKQSSTVQRQIKYGVVSTNDLIQDLLRWDYLYLAGRMHKPIVSIDLPPQSTADPDSQSDEYLVEQRNDRIDEILEAQRTNLLSAVSASLLLHKTDDTNNLQSHGSTILPMSQLYNTIASLSYTGDFRMQTGAEDPNKVAKLVETPGMLDLWDDMYSDTLNNLQNMGLLSVIESNQSDDRNITITGNKGKQLEANFNDIAMRKQLVQHLPQRLQKHSNAIVDSDCNNLRSIHQGTSILRQELAKIVSPAAKTQSMKGFITAGPIKSWKYALAKFAKGRLKK